VAQRSAQRLAVIVCDVPTSLTDLGAIECDSVIRYRRRRSSSSSSSNRAATRGSRSTFTVEQPQIQLAEQAGIGATERTAHRRTSCSQGCDARKTWRSMCSKGKERSPSAAHPQSATPTPTAAPSGRSRRPPRCARRPPLLPGRRRGAAALGYLYCTFGMQRLIFSAKYRVLVWGGCSRPKIRSGIQSVEQSGRPAGWRLAGSHASSGKLSRPCMQ
jgi:hypothetical protein